MLCLLASEHVGWNVQKKQKQKHLQTNNVNKMLLKVKIDVWNQAPLVEAVSLVCVCGQQAFAQYHSDLCVITPQSHKWAVSVSLPAAKAGTWKWILIFLCQEHR